MLIFRFGFCAREGTRAFRKSCIKPKIVLECYKVFEKFV